MASRALALERDDVKVTNYAKVTVLQWEKRLLRFLELSGAGRIVASGEDEEEAWARRMDEWIVWEDGM